MAAQRKRFALLIGFLLLAALLSACLGQNEYTFQLETGDALKISGENGYTLSGEIPFTLSKNEVSCLTGSFLSLDGFMQYEEILLEENSTLTLLERGKREDCDYLFYHSESEGGYGILLSPRGSASGVLLESTLSEQEVRDAFSALRFSLP